MLGLRGIEREEEEEDLSGGTDEEYVGTKKQRAERETKKRERRDDRELTRAPWDREHYPDRELEYLSLGHWEWNIATKFFYTQHSEYSLILMRLAKLIDACTRIRREMKEEETEGFKEDEIATLRKELEKSYPDEGEFATPRYLQFFFYNLMAFKSFLYNNVWYIYYRTGKIATDAGQIPQYAVEKIVRFIDGLDQPICPQSMRQSHSRRILKRSKIDISGKLASQGDPSSVCTKKSGDDINVPSINAWSISAYLLPIGIENHDEYEMLAHGFGRACLISMAQCSGTKKSIEEKYIEVFIMKDNLRFFSRDGSAIVVADSTDDKRQYFAVIYTKTASDVPQEYIGRIFVRSNDPNVSVWFATAIQQGFIAFANNPRAVLEADGKLLNKCCLCGMRLTCPSADQIAAAIGLDRGCDQRLLIKEQKFRDEEQKHREEEQKHHDDEQKPREEEKTRPETKK